jgi:hypothetical protein
VRLRRRDAFRIRALPFSLALEGMARRKAQSLCFRDPLGTAAALPLRESTRVILAGRLDLGLGSILDCLLAGTAIDESFHVGLLR